MKFRLSSFLLTLSFVILLVCATNPDTSNENTIQDNYDDYDYDYNTVTTTSQVLNNAEASSTPSVTPSTNAAHQTITPNTKGPQLRSPKNFQEILQRIYSLKFSQIYRELGLLALLLVYFLVYYRGSNINEVKATEWLKNSLGYFQTQFAQIGDERGFFLMRNGPDDFIFYASGRVGCKLMYGHIFLFPRHDIIKFFYNFYAPVEDHVSISIPLPDTSDSFIFSVLPRKLANQLRRERHDINIFTKQTNVKGLPQGIVALTEHSDITNQVLTNNITNLISKVKDELLEVTISDQPTTKPTAVPQSTSKILTFKYKLTSNGQKIETLHKLLTDLIDTLDQMPKLRNDVKNKLKKIREDAYKELSKEETQLQREEVENRVAERRRKELEDVMKMSPEAQRKFEEKEQRKKDKKNKGKVMIRS